MTCGEVELILLLSMVVVLTKFCFVGLLLWLSGELSHENLPSGKSRDLAKITEICKAELGSSSPRP